MIKIKRIYAKLEKDDGLRILVDRLWPRGITKEKAKIDFWFKDAAPSNWLRKWFSHDMRRWASFKRKYKNELKGKPKALEQIKQLTKKEKFITFLYAAKDEKHNNAIALKEILK